MRLLTVVSALAAAMGVAAGQPTITSVANAASNLPQGLPNSGIAQGSIFIVKGTGLGPDTIAFAQTAFQSSTLAGSSISVTVGSTTVNALMYYASAAQLAALLPSNTPTGSGTLTVTYSGTASSTFAVQVVANNIGIFSFSQDGQGLAIATYPDYSLVSAVPGTGTLADTCSAGKACPYTYGGAPHPGDVITLWATGLGAVSGGDGTSSLGQTNAVGITLWIGGVSVPITYQGRSGCCIGEDQIAFTVPSGAGSGQPGTIPGGCAVPVVLQIGTLLSNATLMPITASGRSCTPQSPALTSSAVQALTTATGPFNFSTAELGRQLFSVTSSGSFYDDFAQISFGPISETYHDQNTQPLVLSSLDSLPLGTCLTYNAALSGNPALITYLGGADAGTVTINGQYGQLPLTNHGGTPTVYGAILSGQGTYFSLGSYSVSSVNGRDISPFTLRFTIAATPTWDGVDQNRIITSGVTRANGMTLNWTPGSASYNLAITGSSYTDGTGQVGAAFICSVPSTLGTFTVPAQVLLTLPSTPFTEIDFKPVLPAQGYSSTELNVGIMNFQYQTSIFGAQFK